MPNSRDPKLRFVGFWLEPEFFDAINAARKRYGEAMSVFTRKALAEALRKTGIAFNEAQVFGRDRVKPKPPKRPVSYRWKPKVG